MDPILTNLISTQEKRHNIKRSSNSEVISNGNKPFMIGSRSPSPDESIINTKFPASKPNQVSNVILYGIPIVSLYIESQERLCLAQISNTLLKQFSYNEIHNRRVALGITCVQCTPVQLEILRRAGAMPVSSRRCGMITRREAERLCKSFLGDNSPPRLPDDFSFGVFHECAWGCRGAFLPSRYNSSRAKCIKCSYCGLFFSPNKFIFHSHRVSANDKYVQPDAANFNSWRRHLRLSGTPLDDIQHAWEDVKAMFNGGTRKTIKRIMSTPVSPIRDHNPSNSSSAKRSKDTSVNASTNSVSQFPTRSTIASLSSNVPIPQAPQPKSENSITQLITPNAQSLRTSESFPQELPFSLSRSFMIDYMWHHQQQQQASSSAPMVANKANHLQFPTYSALNWIKQPPPSFLFKPNATSIVPLLNPINDDKPSATIFNHFHSAFKPVINMRSNDEMISSGGLTNQCDEEHQLALIKKPTNRRKYLKHKDAECYVDVDEESSPDENINCMQSEHSDNIDRNTNCQLTSSDDENEMVDIETTEDDIQILNLQPFHRTIVTEVSEDRISQLESNNNDIGFFEASVHHNVVKSPKSPVRSVKEIIPSNERESDECFNHFRRTSPANHECSLNLKKEPTKHDAPSESPNYIHKIHGNTNCEENSESVNSPTAKKSNELWSVARLSMECCNSKDDSLKTSIYHHLSQIQQRCHHNLDLPSSASH